MDMKICLPGETDFQSLHAKTSAVCPAFRTVGNFSHPADVLHMGGVENIHVRKFFLLLCFLRHLRGFLLRGAAALYRIVCSRSVCLRCGRRLRRVRCYRHGTAFRSGTATLRNCSGSTAVFDTGRCTCAFHRARRCSSTVLHRLRCPRPGCPGAVLRVDRCCRRQKHSRHRRCQPSCYQMSLLHAVFLRPLLFFLLPAAPCAETGRFTEHSLFYTFFTDMVRKITICHPLTMIRGVWLLTLVSSAVYHFLSGQRNRISPAARTKSPFR